MNVKFPDILNVHLLNGLTVVGLLFLYMLFARTYYATRRDRSSFFLFGGLAWLVNLLYLVVEDLSKEYLGLADGFRLVLILSLNTVSMAFFLLAARQRFSSTHPRLSNAWTIGILTMLVFAIPFITKSHFPNHIWIGETIAVFFSFFAIFVFGYSYRSFFRVTRQHFVPSARYCLILSMYFYAVLQFGHFVKVPEYQVYFFLAGMVLKLVHIFGLFRFSESFFADYEKKHLAYKQADNARRLADQLAHELNAPAIEMRLRLSRLEKHHRNPGAVLEQIKEMGNLVEQLNTLVGSFRSLHTAQDSRDNETTPEICNVNRICESAIMTLKLVMQPNVKFMKNYCAGPLVFGVEAKLLQVFENILKNAIEATKQVESPRIEVSTSIRRDDSRQPVNVLVRVQDTGPGIDEQNLPKIFLDGFSTKDLSDPGGGHGLYIAKRIVEEHGGTIEARPSGHKSYTGACFQVTLPYRSTLESD